MQLALHDGVIAVLGEQRALVVGGRLAEPEAGRHVGVAGGVVSSRGSVGEHGLSEGGGSSRSRDGLMVTRMQHLRRAWGKGDVMVLWPEAD